MKEPNLIIENLKAILEECTASEDAVSYVNSEDAGTLKAAIEALEKQEQDRWHSVAKEGNPPKMGFYLWSARGGAVEIDFFDGEKWEKATTYLYEVLAWKYRPKAYTEEEA